MNQLKEMLEAYRNGERGLPTYDELAAIAYNQSSTLAMANVQSSQRHIIEAQANEIAALKTAALYWGKDLEAQEMSVADSILMESAK